MLATEAGARWCASQMATQALSCAQAPPPGLAARISIRTGYPLTGTWLIRSEAAWQLCVLGSSGAHGSVVSVPAGPHTTAGMLRRPPQKRRPRERRLALCRGKRVELPSSSCLRADVPECVYGVRERVATGALEPTEAGACGAFSSRSGHCDSALSGLRPPSSSPGNPGSHRVCQPSCRESGAGRRTTVVFWYYQGARTKEGVLLEKINAVGNGRNPKYSAVLPGV